MGFYNGKLPYLLRFEERVRDIQHNENKICGNCKWFGKTQPLHSCFKWKNTTIYPNWCEAWEISLFEMISYMGYRNYYGAKGFLSKVRRVYKNIIVN